MDGRNGRHPTRVPTARTHSKLGVDARLSPVEDWRLDQAAKLLGKSRADLARYAIDLLANQLDIPLVPPERDLEAVA